MTNNNETIPDYIESGLRLDYNFNNIYEFINVKQTNFYNERYTDYATNQMYNQHHGNGVQVKQIEGIGYYNPTNYTPWEKGYYVISEINPYGVNIHPYHEIGTGTLCNYNIEFERITNYVDYSNNLYSFVSLSECEGWTGNLTLNKYGSDNLVLGFYQSSPYSVLFTENNEFNNTQYTFSLSQNTVISNIAIGFILKNNFVQPIYCIDQYVVIGYIQNAVQVNAWHSIQFQLENTTTSNDVVINGIMIEECLDTMDVSYPLENQIILSQIVSSFNVNQFILSIISDYEYFLIPPFYQWSSNSSLIINAYNITYTNISVIVMFFDLPLNYSLSQFVQYHNPPNVDAILNYNGMYFLFRYVPEYKPNELNIIPFDIIYYISCIGNKIQPSFTIKYQLQFLTHYMFAIARAPLSLFNFAINMISPILIIFIIPIVIWIVTKKPIFFTIGLIVSSIIMYIIGSVQPTYMVMIVSFAFMMLCYQYKHKKGSNDIGN